MKLVHFKGQTVPKPKKYKLSQDKEAIRAFVERWKIKNNEPLEKLAAKKGLL